MLTPWTTTCHGTLWFQGGFLGLLVPNPKNKIIACVTGDGKVEREEEKQREGGAVLKL